MLYETKTRQNVLIFNIIIIIIIIYLFKVGMIKVVKKLINANHLPKTKMKRKKLPTIVTT